MSGRPVDDNYSRNQCALMIRVDGEELYIPLDFGRSADEVKAVYPYLLDMFQNTVKNPAVDFSARIARGEFKDMEETEYRKLLDTVRKASMLFYNRFEENLLAIALRFAVDIKLRSLEELYFLFETVTPPELIKPGKPMDIREAERVLQAHGMVHPLENEHDAGDEKDVAPGSGGQVKVDLYEGGEPADKPAEATVETGDGAEPRKTKTLPEMKPDGLLGLYEDPAGSVFDELDGKDGLKDPKYDKDYDAFRHPEEDTSGESGISEQEGQEELGSDIPEDEGEPDGLVPFGSIPGEEGLEDSGEEFPDIPGDDE